ncbi:hypothetical protein [Falsiroseomonas sp. E2-1-a4]|uniref:hypothetical protein n=1 Tax=Falsiroseomonas sp. E2-1-a4 TaxID=3239299 RepID=UPI003F2A75AF
MFRIIQWLFNQPIDPPEQPETTSDRSNPEPNTNEGYRTNVRTVLIPNLASGGHYEKDLSSPFWNAMSKMTEGSFVRYESVDREWHVFAVVDPPAYGRLGHHDLSIVVRRVSTLREFTMPARLLSPCDASFRRRDGSRIRPGEGHR